MEPNLYKRKGGGSACINQHASENYKLYQREMLPQQDLLHYLPLRHLNFCHQQPLPTRSTTEPPAMYSIIIQSLV